MNVMTPGGFNPTTKGLKYQELPEEVYLYPLISHEQSDIDASKEELNEQFPGKPVIIKYVDEYGPESHTPLIGN